MRKFSSLFLQKVLRIKRLRINENFFERQKDSFFKILGCYRKEGNGFFLQLWGLNSEPHT
jgi:hypothetical protein